MLYILYHGTREPNLKAKDLKPIDPEYAGSLGEGIYCSTNKFVAKYYGDYVLKFEAEINNPLIIDPDEYEPAEQGIELGINYDANEDEDYFSDDSIIPGQSVPPFDLYVKGEKYEIRDSGNLESICYIAKSHGYDSVIMKGVRGDGPGGDEIVLFSSSQIKKQLFENVITMENLIAETIEDRIPGGLSDNMSLKQIAKKHKVSLPYLKKQLQQGIKVELEHTSDKNIAREIAKDHLFEDSNYYVKLKKVEKND